MKGILATCSINRYFNSLNLMKLGYSPICVVNFACEKHSKVIMQYQNRRLAPTIDIFDAVKGGTMTNREFKVAFNQQMLSNPMTIIALHEILSKLSSGKNIVLLCYEENDTNCHRRLLKEYFEKEGITTRVL